MLAARLQARCPSARVVGTARAAGYALEFSKPGRDMSGKATLVVGDTGASVPGVLFEIARSDLPNLDEVEGNGYRRHDGFAVELTGADDRFKASTYLAVATDPRLRPFDWYLALVIAGAVQNRLDERHVKGLWETEYVRDENPNNRWRAEALRAFAREGISDYNLLLR
jgi:hypothetical protein